MHIAIVIVAYAWINARDVILIFKFLERTLMRELVEVEKSFAYVSWRKKISKNYFGCVLVLLRAKKDLT